VATAAEDRLLAGLADKIIDRLDLKAPLDVPRGIEVTRRVKEERETLFVINHLADETAIDLGPEPRNELLTGAQLQGAVQLKAGDVLVLQTIK
jgi:beta-galactosidase